MKFKNYMKSTNMALFVTGAIMVAVLVVIERMFGVLTSINTALFTGLPFDPMTTLLVIMGAAVVIMMSLFSVILAKRMKMKISM